MIKLPKDVVAPMVEELTGLVQKAENQPTQEQIDAVVAKNADIDASIQARRQQIEMIEQEIKNLETQYAVVPEKFEEVDETRMEELTQMLILSGYFKKMVDEEGNEYLQSTGIYDTKEPTELEPEVAPELEPEVEEETKEPVIPEEMPTTEELAVEKQPEVEEAPAVEEIKVVVEEVKED